MKPQEALNHFKEQICKHCCKWDKSLRHCNDCPTGIAIKALEKQATSEWIPVSEGLPKEDYDTVLVFLESNIYDIAIWHSEYGFRPWYAGYFEEATPEWESKVLAWQPLPEPWKGEVNE